jgi:hypothetical protein
MMTKPKMLLLGSSIVLLLFGPATGLSQTQAFTDPDGKYKVTLTGDWKPVTYTDAVGREKTEFTYRDRSEGLLKITREPLNGTLAETVRQEQENLRIYRSGFERASIEEFGGGELSGLRLLFYSTEGPRKVANTYYYLQDKNAVWILRFSGKRGMLDVNRNITDQIARSLKPL